MTFYEGALLVAIGLTLACLALMVTLVIVRVRHDRKERRRLALRRPLWPLVLTLGAGEEEEVEEAQTRLLALSRSERAAIEDDAWAMVPKLRGDARERLREVLQRWGGVDEPRYSTTSRSPVRRARGYYRLGILADPSRLDQLLAGLDDRDFTARRTAVLALGAFPDREVVHRILVTASAEVPLRRDFLASVDQIGAIAQPVLREHLTTLEASEENNPRSRLLAAEALGLVGDLEDAPALESALSGALRGEDELPEAELHAGEDAPLTIACLNSLGLIGSPSSIGPVGEALGHPSAQVRRAAAVAVGMIGSPRAVPVLEAALVDLDVEVARAAANALRRSGRVGTEVLEASDVPVAREVLALAALGSSR
jgi:HEAT repeat protein